MSRLRTHSTPSAPPPILASFVSLALIALVATPAGAAVVINEVLADPMGADDGEERIELYNNGPAAVDIGGTQICVFPGYWGFPAGTMIEAGGYIVVRWNSTGTSSAAEIFTGLTYVPLGAAGGVGYYANADDFGEPANILDYVQWGGPNQGRADVADMAGIWDETVFVAAAAEGMSISLDVDGIDTNTVSDWVERAPSFGGPNAVNVQIRTWGAIKDLFATE